jgi:transposase
MVDSPDHTVIYRVSTCKECRRSLAEAPVTSYERRQVFDLPPLKVEITEHQAEVKRCPNCGCVNKAVFPEEVCQPVQYGPRFKATAVYLSNYQLLPLERQAELFADLFGHRLSQATLVNANQEAYIILEPVAEEIKQQLIAAPVIHCDETGLYVDSKREWLHVVSTEKLTCYATHPKRGQEATKEIGILPDFQGTTVHDFWKPYYQYACAHALCNAHHLRELTGIAEQDKQQWPPEMKDLLLEIKWAVDEAKTKTNRLDPAQIQSFEERYDQIITQGLAENPPLQGQPGKRGRRKQSKAKNLLKRLQEHRQEVLAFMYDFRIPFDNNQAERDIR